MKLKKSFTEHSDEIARYLATVSRIKTSLTAEQEFTLGYEYKTASEQRKREIERLLVENNYRFVISVAKNYVNLAPLEDLISEGAIGLLEAVRKWDPTRGVKLISFAVNYIRKNIIDYLTNNSYLVRLPSDVYNLLHRVKRHSEEILNKYGSITPTSIAEFFGCPPPLAERTWNVYNRSFVSLDKPVRKNDEPACIVDVVGTEELSPVELISDYEDIQQLYNALEKLPQKEKLVVQLYYGIQCTKQPVGVIADMLGVHRNQIPSILASGIKKLKRILHSL